MKYHRIWMPTVRVYVLDSFGVEHIWRLYHYPSRHLGYNIISFTESSVADWPRIPGLPTISCGESDVIANFYNFIRERSLETPGKKHTMWWWKMSLSWGTSRLAIKAVKVFVLRARFIPKTMDEVEKCIGMTTKF